jgi:hypothetical protein
MTPTDLAALNRFDRAALDRARAPLRLLRSVLS